MRLVTRIIFGYFLFILVVNLGFWALVGLRFGPVSDLYRDGLVIKVRPLGRAYVFAHGNYDYGYDFDESFPEWSEGRQWLLCWNDEVVYHRTTFGDLGMSTLDYVDGLRGEGYNYVWGSWCESGDHPYIVKYPNGSVVPWPDWVSRNERPGVTIPVFWGLGFVRI